MSSKPQRFTEWTDTARMGLLMGLGWLGAGSAGYHSDPGGGLNVVMPEELEGGQWQAVMTLLYGAGLRTDGTWMDDPATGRRVMQFRLKDGWFSN